MGIKLAPINILFITYLVLMGIVSAVLFFPAIFINLFRGAQYSDKYIKRIGSFYARHILNVFGAKIKVTGLENIPESNQICFVSNHQGSADIPLIVGFIPKPVGFIAKKELGRIPILNFWLKALRCILIDRSNIRDSISIIDRGIGQILAGHPLVVFPEGTRSKKNKPGIFKPGAFKLLTGSNAIAIPLTIDGSYKFLEETGKIRPARINLTIHPPIYVSSLSADEKKKLPNTIQEIIQTKLPLQ